MSTSDEAIQLTNNDASFFKAYAVKKGYWHDPYIEHFVSSSSTSPASGTALGPTQRHLHEQKPPEMSRGYFARVSAIRQMAHTFLDTCAQRNTKCQIINLGAGYDTLYFNLLDRYSPMLARYVEVDFARIVASKVRLIKSKSALCSKLSTSQSPAVTAHPPPPLPPPPSTSSAFPFRLPPPPPAPTSSTHELHTANYDLIVGDLRNVAELDAKFKSIQLDFTLPTLVIAECVLVYMSVTHSHALVEYLREALSGADALCMISYEQVNLDDKFGEVMLANMQHRDCKLLGVDACLSVASQASRFRHAGFRDDLVSVITMSEYYTRVLERAERERVEKLEHLDESELFYQLMDHYCVCTATTSDAFKHILFTATN